jgi:hypothetical protein
MGKNISKQNRYRSRSDRSVWRNVSDAFTYLLSVRVRYRSRVKIKLVTMSRRTCDVRSSFTSRLRIVKLTFTCLDDYAMLVTSAHNNRKSLRGHCEKARCAYDRVTERFCTRENLINAIIRVIRKYESIARALSKGRETRERCGKMQF